MNTLFGVLAICLVTGAPALGADRLVVTSRIIDSRYCLGPNGRISLKLQVAFDYRNVGDAPVVLPGFSRLSGYAIFRDEADFEAQKSVSRLSYGLRDIFRTLGQSASDPYPQLFQSIPPGGAAGRADEVFIPLVIPGRDLPPLLGTSPLIQFTIDNWPGHKHIAASRHVWQPLGILWASQDTPPPVRLNIDKNPVAAPCYPRVD